MTRIWGVAVATVALALAGGVAYLASTDVRSPPVEVEKVLPNERFRR